MFLRAATRLPGAADRQLSEPQLSVPRVPNSAFVPSSGDYGAFSAGGGATGDKLTAQLQQTAEKFGAACASLFTVRTARRES